MFKIQGNLRSTLLLGVATAAAVSIGGSAYAQQASNVETVVVTGSRIPQAGLVSSSPVTSVGSQELKFEGATTVEQTLRDLPATVADTDNQFVNNGSGGIATVDLRGLGNRRTLVLVDGKRLVASDELNDVDLNQIPPILIDHVEVLTGGASAIYGADAVAGVVNLILRKDYEGVEADVQYKQTDHNDGQTYDASLMMGANADNGKGNITAYFDYQHRSPIFQGNRDYSATATSSPYYDGCPSSFTPIFGGFCAFGSSASQEGNFLGAYHATSSGTFDPGLTHYNFNPVNYFLTPNDRYAFGATGHYKIANKVELYGRLTYSDNRSVDQLAPTPIVSTFDVNYGNPFLSNQERAILFGAEPCYATSSCGPNDTASFGFRRRLVENGNRVQTFDISAYQVVIGARGELDSVWSYDISAQYGHVTNVSRYSGDAQFNAFQQGLLVNPDGSCMDPSGGCSPINIFTTGSISQDAVNFFTLSMDALRTVSQWDMQANFVGDLGEYGIQSPWARDSVEVSLGSEYRQEEAASEPDQNLATGNDLGFGQTSPAVGGYDVAEGYVELRAPLMQDKPFVRLLQVDGAYRYSQYNLAGPSNTYKYSGEWAPTDDIRFRASYERAVRAPNVGELFQSSQVSANSGNDPCSANTGGITTTMALCVATLPANHTAAAVTNIFTGALTCPSGQCTAVVGGNEDLKPERADTRSIGFVFTPTFIDGFDATVDWYDINVARFIAQLPLQSVLNLCYSTTFNPSQSASNAYCQLVHRNAAGEIFGEPVPPGGDVKTLTSNIANYKVRGMDFEANYTSDFDYLGLPSGWGSLAFNFKGTYTNTSDYRPDPTSPVEHCAGLFGDICPNGVPTPTWRHNLRVSYLSPGNDFTVSLLWRHISGVRFDETVINGLNDPLDAHIPSFDWFDLSGTWDVSNGLSLRAGVTNLFGKKPPLVDFGLAPASADSGNTFPGTYDPVGRFFFIGATAKL